MKIAVPSDIHGNIAALEAVLAHAAGFAPDRIVNLGDICSGALWPAETADRLMALDLPTIRGNHERQVLDGDVARMGPSDRHSRMSPGQDHLAWLAGPPPTLRLSDDVLLVHGTLASDLDYFLETVTPTGVRAAMPQEVTQRAGDARAELILCGHTHVPRAAQLADGRLIVNPGSVGLPAYDDIHPFPHAIENGSPHARYATVTRERGGWQVSFHLVRYDWERTARYAEENGRADWARALRSGHA
ncbi:metallophosphoesterase family protein [Croceicoccus marinus]|uniref:YfcE family phosphodiesterase n=1 Tax=Croceicoccus marinus TaxID=450378 RepID=A0A1Z1FD32_9SPHN|nr:metallophosphoesterase family protein [Croceicoccus marinus]ARU16597.1 YfcE family phosphodiesterase [Croceicoccus marinus]